MYGIAPFCATIYRFDLCPKISFKLVVTFREIFDVGDQLVSTVVFNMRQPGPFSLQTHIQIFGYQHHLIRCEGFLQVQCNINDAVVVFVAGKNLLRFDHVEISKNRQCSRRSVFASAETFKGYAGNHFFRGRFAQ